MQVLDDDEIGAHDDERDDPAGDRNHAEGQDEHEGQKDERHPEQCEEAALDIGRVAELEVRDTLAYLRLIAYRDDLSFLRVANVPKRNLGERRMRFLQDFAAGKYDILCNSMLLTEGWDCPAVVSVRRWCRRQRPKPSNCGQLCGV